MSINNAPSAVPSGIAPCTALGKDDMSLQTMFEQQWASTSADDLHTSKEAAMHWFFAGVGAQKQVCPPVRMADAEAFARQRKPREAAGYREAGLTPEEERLRWFLDLIRQYNYMVEAVLRPDQEELSVAVSAIKLMENNGLKIGPWLTTNILAGRTKAMLDYNGSRTLLDLLETLKKRAIPAQS